MRNPRLRGLAEDIDRILAGEPFELDAADVRELVEVVLLFVAQVVDIPALERRMLSATRVNFELVEPAIRCFDSATSTKQKMDVSKVLEELKGLLPFREQEAAGSLGTLRAVATSQHFERLLINTEGGDIDEFERLLAQGIATMDDADVSNVLGAVQSECSPDGLNGAKAGSDAVRELILTNEPGRARELLPTFLARDRPDLQRKKLAYGEEYPCLVSLGRILAFAKPKLAQPLDLRVSRCLSHAYGLFVAIQGEAATFAARLGIEEASYFQQWHEIDRRLWRWGKARPDDPQRALLMWVRRLASYTDAHIDWASPVEAAVRAYKLGLEVQWEPKHPEASDVDKDWHEHRFQRHAIRFLLERGIRAFGTKLGSYEQDFVAGDGDEALVVEAKIYREAKGAAELRTNIGQLLQYLDHQEPGRRGIVCIYNFSAMPIIAPREWIGNQYMVLVINLCSITASEARKRRVIKPAAGLAVDVEDV